MSERTYPYKAWLLTRSFQPLEIELVARGYIGSAYDCTEAGRNYHIKDLYPSKEAVIAYGERRLAELAEELAKQNLNLEKRRCELLRHK